MNHPLEQLQRWLQAVITHPDGVAEGVASDAARGEIDVAPQDVERVIARSKALTSIERLEIYGSAYYARLLECLRESFPVLAHAVGREAFDQFAFGYLQSYPSTSYTLGKLGARFADYLEQTRPDRVEADAGEIGWPDLLIDLARLEWEIGEVFDGPGVEREPVLNPAALQAIPPERWPGARLVTVPCLRLLAFRFNVNDYFTAVRAALTDAQQQEPEMPAPEPTYLALTRINYVVRRIALSGPQYALLTALAAGETVGQAIEALAADSRNDVERLAQDLPRWFQDWAEARLFRAVELPE
ncbi:MAG: DNA-binding domain-containing protein [Planctomycetes bacterium]|nr:DNA-binding domain-containing protein [Planctomycetota bacterium]